MDTSKYIVKGTSYQNLFESFQNLFPEWKKSIKEWKKDDFNKTRRSILITLKNDIQIRFGCYKESDLDGWVWAAYAMPSEKNREKLGIATIDKDDDFFGLDKDKM